MQAEWPCLQMQLNLSLLRNTGIELGNIKWNYVKTLWVTMATTLKEWNKLSMKGLSYSPRAFWVEGSMCLTRGRSEGVCTFLVTGALTCLSVNRVSLVGCLRPVYFRLRSQTIVRQGLRGFYLLINISDNWLAFNTEMHLLHGWLPNC